MTKFTNRIIWFLERVVTAMIVVTVILIAMQIFMRYVVSRPLSWTEQVSRYLFVWMMMLGIPIMFHRKMYMAFDLLFDALSAKQQKILGLVIKAAICCFAVFYFRHSLNLCIQTWGRLTAGVKIPLYLVYGAQPVSAFFIFLVVLNQLIQDFKGGEV